jgi:uncharacterized protein YlxW (UPF0749 family)
MKTPLRIIIFALIGTLILWTLYLFVVGFFFKRDWLASGQFGDTFGALNTLFTGWAFVVVLATLILQSRQIAETKHDLQEERQLQKRTAELVAEQAKALALQARLNALTARIEAFHVQIHDAKDRGSNELTNRLSAERHALLLKLDEVLRSHGD